jgi:hypothetical protein
MTAELSGTPIFPNAMKLARELERIKAEYVSLMMERAMSRALMLTGAVVVFSVLAKRGRPNRPVGIHSNCYTDRPSFKQFELTANNLKTATKKVDDSAARVEVALKTLAAA